MMAIIAVLILALLGWLLISLYKKKRRKDALLKKYGDAEVVTLIMKKMFWQGQTEEQLRDSLGRPLDTDEKVLKTKTKEIWKYNRVGKNRYGLRVTLENGIVVGWEQK
ncbi:hypothetical protein [Acidithiobacillus albertensis]|uniref:hypothetical protein n=1 Tax=Acidithiobacillus albertensis TaxID=119978 RepID=UPI000B1617C1|nr:hypothetical protein [Acidithiobacillus albertensis]